MVLFSGSCSALTTEASSHFLFVLDNEDVLVSIVLETSASGIPVADETRASRMEQGGRGIGTLSCSREKELVVLLGVFSSSLSSSLPNDASSRFGCWLIL